MAHSLAIVPKSLGASTRKGLERLMLLNNAKVGAFHRYYDFYYDPNKKEHVCWYIPLNVETHQEQEQMARETLNGTN